MNTPQENIQQESANGIAELPPPDAGTSIDLATREPSPIRELKDDEGADYALMRKAAAAAAFALNIPIAFGNAIGAVDFDIRHYAIVNLVGTSFYAFNRHFRSDAYEDGKDDDLRSNSSRGLAVGAFSILLAGAVASTYALGSGGEDDEETGEPVTTLSNEELSTDPEETIETGSIVAARDDQETETREVEISYSEAGRRVVTIPMPPVYYNLTNRECVDQSYIVDDQDDTLWGFMMNTKVFFEAVGESGINSISEHRHMKTTIFLGDVIKVVC